MDSSNFKIWENNLLDFTGAGLNFDSFKFGGLDGTHLSIRLKTEENQEILCRDGTPQDHPDAN
jgi:hypothetical protein